MSTESAIGPSVPSDRPDYESALREEREQVAELQRLVDDFTVQATHDTEELTWFREMTSHFGELDIEREFLDVISPMLPALRELLQTETLAVVTDEGDSERGQVDPVFLTAEGLPFDRAKVLRLVLGCRDAASDGVVVLNNASVIQKRTSVAGVANCMVVAMARPSGQYGWLVAVGKVVERSAAVETCETGVSRGEFGTVEATLLDSAARTLATHQRNVTLFRERKELIVGIIRAMINAVDAKDAYTCGHSDRVALIGRLIAGQMGLPERDRESIYISGLLHDVGKIAVPDSILCKPGALSAEEFDVVKRHPVTGYHMLSHLEKLRPVLPGVLHHHEAWDGSGYPNGLVGVEIPQMARVMAVADAWDAMTSRRPYRSAMPFERAAGILRDGRGGQWDPDVIDAFFECFDEVREISEADGRQTEDLTLDEPSFGAYAEIDSAVLTSAMHML
ncbi:MAG: HD-GYP domain-containing protein [Planctomycetota bacterium]